MSNFIEEYIDMPKEILTEDNVYCKHVDLETDIVTYSYLIEQRCHYLHPDCRIIWMFEKHKQGKLSDDAFLYGIKKQFLESQKPFNKTINPYLKSYEVNYNVSDTIEPYYLHNKCFYENIAEWTSKMGQCKKWLYYVAHVYNWANNILYISDVYIYDANKYLGSMHQHFKYMCKTFLQLIKLLCDICEFIETNYTFIYLLDTPFIKDTPFKLMVRNMEYNTMKKQISHNMNMDFKEKPKIDEKYRIYYEFENTYKPLGYNPLHIKYLKNGSSELKQEYISFLEYENEYNKNKQPFTDEIAVYELNYATKFCYNLTAGQWMDMHFHRDAYVETPLLNCSPEVRKNKYY